MRLPHTRGAARLTPRGARHADMMAAASRCASMRTMGIAALLKKRRPMCPMSWPRLNKRARMLLRNTNVGAAHCADCAEKGDALFQAPTGGYDNDKRPFDWAREPLWPHPPARAAQGRATMSHGASHDSWLDDSKPPRRPTATPSVSRTNAKAVSMSWCAWRFAFGRAHKASVARDLSGATLAWEHWFN